MTDDNGNVVWRADYKPFGEEQSITGTIENNEKFVGKEKDKETGLYYFGARYMKAEIGRFTSPDPVGAVDPKTSKINEKVLKNPQRLNLYSYGLNNPYKYIDPNGLDVWFIGGGTSLFFGNIGPYAQKDQRGYGIQAGFGIAYDTEKEKVIVFGTGGTANRPEDKVLGFNAWVGIVGGQLKGNLEDFLGERSWHALLIN